MTASIRLRNLSLDVPAFFQNERGSGGWSKLFLGAAFDPPKRRVVRLLDGLSLDVEEGDRLAILGRNGAGKSTLLRVLNGVYQPTSGSMQIEGNCQALLNMSLGFNGYATVRENIILRGVAMGLRARFLRDHADSMLEFAGLQEKSSHLLRTLSSGQKLRLGFAISTVVQHDIILMDEWVGTGDSEFMAKAKERMRSRVGGSKIVVLASHSTGLVRGICNKGIVLEKGRLLYAGEIVSALRYYHQHMVRLRAVGEEIESGGSEEAQVFGALESLEPVVGKEGRFRLQGWMTDGQGRLPEGLAIEVGGYRYPAKISRRMVRNDVADHLGLADAQCGFIATVTVQQAGGSVAALAHGFRALGGASAEYAEAPLRLAPKVLAVLQSD